MPRPFKSGVDYFPLDVVMDDKVKILEAEQDIIGFAVWVKLHQKVYANNYWINWDKKAKIIFSNEVNVDINKVNDVINSCMEWGIFDKKVFDEYSVLTSRGIQKRYFYICRKRLRMEIVTEYTLIEVPKIDKQEIVIVNINPVNDCESTQSKVKDSKPKEKDTTKLFLEKAFEKWWVTYPKRTGRRIGKKEAKKKFLEIKQNDWPNLKTATVNYNSYLKESGLSCCDAHRFLTETWKEYIEQADNSNSSTDQTNDYLEQLKRSSENE